jgi:hypothetical protein
LSDRLLFSRISDTFMIGGHLLQYRDTSVRVSECSFVFVLAALLVYRFDIEKVV